MFLRFTIGTEAEKDGPWEVHTLSIKDAVLGDAGGFQVIAKNRVGETNMDTKLEVVTEEPGFISQLKDCQGSVQQSRLVSQFVFQCCNLPQLCNTQKNVQFHLNLHFNLQF